MHRVGWLGRTCGVVCLESEPLLHIHVDSKSFERDRMGWLSKLTPAGRKAAQTAKQSMQEELDRLTQQSTEAALAQAELQSSLETAISEREAILAESAQSLATERQQNEDRIKAWNEQFQAMNKDLGAAHQNIAALNASLASHVEILRERDRTISELQIQIDRHRAADSELQNRTAELETHVAKLVSEVDAERQSSRSGANRIRELEAEVASGTSKTASRLKEVEQQLAMASKNAAEQIKILEQKLAESEARSARRAEQRSALLRNLADINRLSALVVNTEANQGQLPSSSSSDSPFSDENLPSSASEPVVLKSYVPKSAM